MQNPAGAQDGLSDRERARRARQRAESLIEPLGVSIADASVLTSECEWRVKEKLRLGIYRAKKSGRRTIIDFQSIKEHWAALPEAKFLPPTRGRAKDAAAASIEVAEDKTDTEIESARRRGRGRRTHSHEEVSST
jgi:hypothetical protein